MSIEIYGAEARTRVAARYIAGDALLQNGRHFVLLPIPTTKDKKHISGTETELSKTLDTADEKTIIAGYALPKEYTETAKAKGIEILDLSIDEAFLEDNAYITAIGALGHILSEEKRIPSDIRFGIIGYGRIGKSLVRLLLFMGAGVKVYTTRLLTHIELSECGVESVFTGDKSGGVYNFSGIDILINTAPKDMTNSFEDASSDQKMRIVELASGENFCGIPNVTKLPALPERMFPESSGETYYRAVKRFLQYEVDKN